MFRDPLVLLSTFILNILSHLLRIILKFVGFICLKKIEVSDIFVHLHLIVQTQFQTQILILRIDNGSMAQEYFYYTLNHYLQKYGIMHQRSYVYTSQQNGLTKRKYRHLLELARALMITTNISKIFWKDAVVTATYLINRMPSCVFFFKTPI